MASTFISLPAENGGSGTVLLSTIEPIGNNTILGNNTGATHYPVALTASEAETLIGLQNFGYVQIAQTLFTDSLSDSLTISAIPQNYASLKLIFSIKSTDSTVDVQDQVLLRMNGDSGSNYDWLIFYTGAGSGTSTAFLSDHINLGSCANNVAVTQYVSPMEFLIPGYASSVFVKSLVGQSVLRQPYNNTGLYIQYTGANWLSTAPLTSLTIYLANAGSKIMSGSCITLYGLR